MSELFKIDQNIFKNCQTFQLPCDPEPGFDSNYHHPPFLGEFSTHAPLNSVKRDNQLETDSNIDSSFMRRDKANLKYINVRVLKLVLFCVVVQRTYC